MKEELKLWKVSQVNFCKYSETQGCIVVAKNWHRAKGMALNKYPYWKEKRKDNIVVEEVVIDAEKIVSSF